MSLKSGAVFGGLLFCVLLSWSLTTPVGGYPDDSFHFANVWCDGGIQGIPCSISDDGSKRLVPNSFTDGSPWWEADGLGEAFGDFGNSYPRLFYSVMKVFAGEDVVLSVYLMRVFNALVATSLVMLALGVLVDRLRVPFLASWLVVGPSLLFYYVASSHPMAWAFTGVGTGWAFAASIFSQLGWRKIAASLVGLSISVFLLLGSRPEGQILAVGTTVLGATFGLAMLLKGIRFDLKRLNPKALSLIVLPLFAGVYWTLRFGLSSETRALITGVVNAARVDLQTKVIEVPFLYFGSFVSNSRMSEDISFGVHFAPALLTLGAVSVIGLSQMSRVKTVMLSIICGLSFLAPHSILVDSRGALFTPPRYLVPFMIFVVVGLMFDVQIDMSGVYTKLFKVVAFFLFVAHSLSLHGAIRPFYVGESTSWKVNLNEGLKWWWQVGPSPLSVWLIGTLSFGALLMVVPKLVMRSRILETTGK